MKSFIVASTSLRGLLKINLFFKIMSHSQQSVACSFDGDTSINEDKLVYPAASRNKEPILKILKNHLKYEEVHSKSNILFLEVASGSGQHVAHFAPHFPAIKFQPSEFDSSLIGSINYYARNCPTKNILSPLVLDIRNKLSEYGFMKNSIDYIYNANMIHISPFECTIGLFKNAGMFLKPDGLMITYGPYANNGIISPESNIEFDKSLRLRDPSWGIRDINDLKAIGSKNKLSLKDIIDMPANNKTLIWIKK